jgi:hypothetical protein
MLRGAPYFFRIRLRSFSAAALPRFAVTQPQDLALMVDCAPQIAELTVDLHEHLNRMPAPPWIGAHVCDTSLANLGGKHWAKPIPPQPDGLVADVDPALG